jgi:hypothetical protein
LPFALVAGACAHWVFGLSQRPALRAGATVEAALAVLRPWPGRWSPRGIEISLRKKTLPPVVARLRRGSGPALPAGAAGGHTG